MITKEQECDIISDLLPLYLEEKASAESVDFIREHLECCATCRKNLELMGASCEVILLENMQVRKQYAGDAEVPGNGRCKGYKRNHFFGKAKGRLFVYGYLFFLLCWWMYIIACYI